MAFIFPRKQIVQALQPKEVDKAAPLAEKPQYAFADYLTWDENERIELLDG